MALSYHPHRGDILICNYPKGMQVPEMVKRRPVVVISPRLRRRGNLVTIIPLSTTEPNPVMDYHHEINLEFLLPEPWDNQRCWAICDHPMTVCLKRLDLIQTGKDQYGKRRYLQKSLCKTDLDGVIIGVSRALQIN